MGYLVEVLSQQLFQLVLEEHSLLCEILFHSELKLHIYIKTLGKHVEQKACISYNMAFIVGPLKFLSKIGNVPENGT